MEQVKRQQIINALGEYVERYGSQSKAAATLTGVSRSTISRLLSGDGDMFDDKMLRTIAAQIGFSSDEWEPVDTTNYRRLTKILTEAQNGSLVMAVTGDAGSGKTFACRQYAAANPNVCHICCNEYWNRKLFLQELMRALAISPAGMTVGEMMQEIVHALKATDHPLIIFDEADKLSDHVLYFFITFYNNLEDHCGMILLATQHLEKRLKAGERACKRGYSEIWSRLGRKCIHLRRTSAADIVAICMANGITARADQDAVVEDSEQDLRRVRRKVYALLRLRSGQAAAPATEPATDQTDR